MASCKAMIREGTRKGRMCLFPPTENGYCGRHQRYKIYDDGIAEGKKWCRLFFRGCNNTVSDNKTCSVCLQSKYTEIATCQHYGCKSHVKTGKYCGKHIRDIYKDIEKETNIRYCDIARGCFRVCEEGKSSCSSCLHISRVKDMEIYNKNKELHNLIEHISSSSNICCRCSKEYIPFLTHANKYSKICKDCNSLQRKADVKRINRKRNYVKEKELNIDSHIREYCTRASKRRLVYELTPEEFKELVRSPCYYCKSSPDSVHGIDRIDNSKGYRIDNCTTACSICNRMKYIFDIDFFLEKCIAIASATHFTDDQFKKWHKYYDRKRSASFSLYKIGAIKRGLIFSLTKEEFTDICKGICYLCGYNGLVGIDRYNNNIGYLYDNCRSCCYSCNIMKGELSYEELYNKATQIVIAHQKLTQSIEPITAV